MRQNANSARPQFVSLALLTAALQVGCTAELMSGENNAEASAANSVSDDPEEEVESVEKVIVGEVECGSSSVGSTPIRLLTREQFGAHVSHVFPEAAVSEDALANLPQTLEAAGYERNACASVDASHQERLLEIAEAVADAVVAGLDQYIDCAPSEECARSFAERYGRISYRKTLEPEQLDELMQLFASGTSDEEGMKLLTQGLILSPDALYQFEVGSPEPDGSRRLSGVELASKLSFLLWNRAPDSELLDAAESGELDTAEGVAERTRSMLKDPRGSGILRFFQGWLHYSHIGDKDTDVFPDFTEEIADAAIEESQRFIAHVLFDADARFETLVTDRTAFVTPELAPLYGLSSPDLAAGAWTQVELPDDERSGLFTRVAFLSATGGTVETSHITRGVDLLHNVLCVEIPEPSAELQDSFPLVPDDPELTPLDIIEIHQADPSCEACHQFIDGVGLGFENYDSIGGFRTTYTKNDKPVVAAGEIVGGGDDLDGPFNGALEFSTRVATSDSGQACFSDNLYRFGMMRSPGKDNCSLALAHAAFSESDFNIIELIAGLTMSPDFRFREGHE